MYKYLTVHFKNTVKTLIIFNHFVSNVNFCLHLITGSVFL